MSKEQNEQDDRAQRLVRHRKWHWMPGMRAGPGSLVYVRKGSQPYQGLIEVVEGAPCVPTKRTLTRGRWEVTFFDKCYPDLTDPGTVGHLLVMLIDAVRDKFDGVAAVNVLSSPTETYVTIRGLPVSEITALYGPSLPGEAIADALLAVWGAE